MSTSTKTTNEERIGDDPAKYSREERIAKGWPVPYLLDEPAERLRLLREVSGYLHTCRRQHHGTDFEGRRLAIEAIESLIKERAFPKGNRP